MFYKHETNWCFTNKSNNSKFIFWVYEIKIESKEERKNKGLINKKGFITINFKLRENFLSILVKKNFKYLFEIYCVLNHINNFLTLENYFIAKRLTNY